MEQFAKSSWQVEITIKKQKLKNHWKIQFFCCPLGSHLLSSHIYIDSLRDASLEPWCRFSGWWPVCLKDRQMLLTWCKIIRNKKNKWSCYFLRWPHRCMKHELKARLVSGALYLHSFTEPSPSCFMPVPNHSKSVHWWLQRVQKSVPREGDYETQVGRSSTCSKLKNMCQFEWKFGENVKVKHWWCIKQLSWQNHSRWEIPLDSSPTSKIVDKKWFKRWSKATDALGKQSGWN